MKDSKYDLKILIVSPQGSEGPLECDSVKVDICDGLKKNQCGLYGIRKGHAKCVFKLEEGDIYAFAKGKLVFKRKLGEGFATVENDFVTVTTQKIYPPSEEETSE